MGNCICTSCCYAEQPQLAKIIDAHGNLRYIKSPITAAEIMLEQPAGHLVSPAYDLRHNSRLTALRADDELSAGKLYMMIPAGRVRSKVSKSDMEKIEFANRKPSARREKQCSSSPASASAETETTSTSEKEEVILLGEKDTTGYMMSSSCRQWKPVLEPIYERI